MNDRIYTNSGNESLINLLDEPCMRLLDDGCGAVDNAALLKVRYPACQVYGITHSAAEAEMAMQNMGRSG